MGTNSTLTAALELQALGIPVQVYRRQGTEPVEVPPDDTGRLSILLAADPEPYVAALIADAPAEAVLHGQEIPRLVVRRRQAHAGDGSVLAADRDSGLPLDRLVQSLDTHGYRTIRRGRGYRAKCPYHGGRSAASLSISERADGAVLMHCFSGCANKDILGVLGLQLADLFPGHAQASGVITHGRQTADRDEMPAAPAALPPPTLPDDFWQSRLVLRQIRRAAHSRMRSADAVLVAILTRVAAGVPYQLKLPAIVGTMVPLSLLAAVLGAPGTGKSSAVGISTEVVPLNPDLVVDGLPIGSGEGLTEALFDWKQVEYTNADGKTVKKTEKYLRYHNAHFNADEGQVLFALSSREGSVLLPTLRSIFTGGTLGQANAERERKRVVPAGQHAFGVVVALQASKAGDLLADVGAGTPQRFLWASAVDPTIPDQAPQWPDLTISLQHLDRFKGVVGSRTLGVPDAVQKEIRANALAAQRGERLLEPMEAHGDLLRLKVAGLLAILDDRVEINAADWQLAGVVKAASDQVRAYVQEVVNAEAVQKEREVSRRQARRQVEATAAVASWRVTECAMKIHAKVKAQSRITVADVRRDLRRWREEFSEGLEYALTEKWVVEKPEPGQGRDKRQLEPGPRNP